MTIKNILCICLLLAVISLSAAPKREFYEIRIWHFKTKQQEAKIDGYLKDAFLPALHRAGILHIGVFKPVEKDTAAFGKRIYVFIPYSSLTLYSALNQSLEKDAVYQKASDGYLSVPFDAPAYNRIESIFMQAFVNSPVFNIPPLSAPAAERIYELRSYESASENLNVSKVKMFNVGDEISLFKRLGFNAVFYANVLSGAHMPNLMYMTTFNSTEIHDKLWKDFFDSPEWIKLKAAPEYQHNVSKVEIMLLHPTDYSDI